MIHMKDIEKELSLLLNSELIAEVQDNSRATAAAVLILLVKVNDDWNVVYTRRTNEVRTHQGEVSFPGGAFEIGDQTLADTALRETWEEIGVDPNCIKILGGLNPTKTISGYFVYPFVGILACLPGFKINREEVERVFLIPIKWLMDDNNTYEKDHILNEQIVKKVIHYRDFDGEHLWGLTARITQEVLALLK